MKIPIIIFFAVFADIFTKWWSYSRLPEISVLGNWLQLTYIRNTGIAFSTPLPGIHILIPLILLGLLIFAIKSWEHISEKEKIGYTLIIVGGCLNALERSIFGSVTDMISMRYFAVFNVADIAITSGVILLLSTVFCQEKTQSKILQIQEK